MLSIKSTQEIYLEEINSIKWCCMSESRKKKSLKNIAVALISNVLIYVLSLFTSKVIKENLGLQVLGLNGVLSNIISILGLSEMGLNSIITFALYKPLAENDKESIKSLIHFYKKAYRIIACIVLIIGLILLPFIPTFIRDSAFSKTYIYIVYLLFLGSSVSSYLFVYKATIITADQKNYILTTASLIFTYSLKISQLLVVIFTSNYILFLSVQILLVLIYNIIISKITDRLYPFLKEKAEKLDQATYQLIITKVKALFISSIATIVLTSTDNILISFFCGVTVAGKYTSYLSLITMISTFITLIFENIRNSIGNFLVTESVDSKKTLYKRLFYANQTLVSICSLCLYFLLSPFITMWLGDDVLLSNQVVFFMVLNFYLQKNRLVTEILRSTAGLFEQFKILPLFEASINLLVSLILGKFLGLTGIILGTIISYLLIPFWVHPFVVYKHIFAENIKEYYKTYLKYFIKTLILYVIISYITKNFLAISDTNFLSFILYAFILFLSVSIAWIILSFRNPDQKYFINLFISKFVVPK